MSVTFRFTRGFRLGKIVVATMTAVLAWYLSVNAVSAAEPQDAAGENSGLDYQYYSGIDISGLLQVVVALVVVIILIMIISTFAKRYNILSGGMSNQIKILAAIPLGSKDRLLLIKVGQEHLLIGSSPGKISKLHKLSAYSEPSTEEVDSSSASKSFASLLSMASSRSSS